MLINNEVEPNLLNDTNSKLCTRMPGHNIGRKWDKAKTGRVAKVQGHTNVAHLQIVRLKKV